MNDDIVARLRIVWTSCSQRINDERNAAADEIERLRGQVAEPIVAELDIVDRLRMWSRGSGMDEAVTDMRDACDEIERLRDLIDKWTDLCIGNIHEMNRLRDQLAARCGDARPGAPTAGPSETFIPEAL
jgi:hypothetical protein